MDLQMIFHFSEVSNDFGSPRNTLTQLARTTSCQTMYRGTSPNEEPSMILKKLGSCLMESYALCEHSLQPGAIPVFKARRLSTNDIRVSVKAFALSSMNSVTACLALCFGKSGVKTAVLDRMKCICSAGLEPFNIFQISS